MQIPGNTLRARRQVLVGLLSLAGLTPAPSSRADELPQRLRILCASPPGGVPDLIARAYAPALSPHFPGGVIIENRPGAGGLVAIGALKQAAADGGTLLLAHSGLVTTNPLLFSRLAYDAQTDLLPVSLAAELDLAFAVGPAVPDSVRTLESFKTWAREFPASCSHGSPGQGTLPHLLAERLFSAIGVRSVHVPYGGGPPLIADLLAGRIAALFLSEGLLRQHTAPDGATQPGTPRLRILATTAAAASPHLPNVPTIAQAGHPELAEREWFGCFAPPNTAAALRQRLSSLLRTAAGTAEVAAALDAQAMRAAATSPEALAERIAGERRRWQTTISALRLRLD